jgi:hypothetical protein
VAAEAAVAADAMAAAVAADVAAAVAAVASMYNVPAEVASVGAAAQGAAVAARVAAGAEASSLEVVEAALPAEAVEAAGEIADYGLGLGPTTAAGESLRLLLRCLLSRRSNLHRQRSLLRKVTEISSQRELNSVRNCGLGQALPRSFR